MHSSVQSIDICLPIYLICIIWPPLWTQDGFQGRKQPYKCNGIFTGFCWEFFYITQPHSTAGSAPWLCQTLTPPGHNLGIKISMCNDSSVQLLEITQNCMAGPDSLGQELKCFPLQVDLQTPLKRTEESRWKKTKQTHSFPATENHAHNFSEGTLKIFHGKW